MKILVACCTLAALMVGLQPARAQQADRPADNAAAASGDAKAAFKDLVGTYEVVRSEKNDEPTPKGKIDMVSVEFTKDRIVAVDKDKKEVYAATYEIDASKKPATITMKSTMDPEKEITVKGLIEKEGDTVRLVYTIPSNVGAQPGEEEGKRQITVVMKKDKKASK